MVGRPAVRRRGRRAHLRAAAGDPRRLRLPRDRHRGRPAHGQFDFNEPFSPALLDIGQQIIAPAHIWSEVDDPAKVANEKPVGTGPYTEVTNFQAQSFDLGKNPNYWQPEKQKIAGIRMLAFAGNDGANLAAANGDVDWAPQFIPNIEKTFVAKDPDNRHYWFPPTGSMINWQLNTTKAPFDDVDVRKALSMAVDREQVTKIGMRATPIPPTAPGCPAPTTPGATTRSRRRAPGPSVTWRERTSCWTTRAHPGRDGKRVLPDGTPFAFDFSVGSTSSDWLSVGNVIAQNLAEVGVTVTVAAGLGRRGCRLRERHFDSGIVWSANAPTPYKYFAARWAPTPSSRSAADVRQLPPLRQPGGRRTAGTVRRGGRRGRAAGHRQQAAGALRRRRPAGAAVLRPRMGRRPTTASPAGPPRTTRTRRSRPARRRRCSC